MVSISLSSGFSFQGEKVHKHVFFCIFVSISLSSGFSFQVNFIRKALGRLCDFLRFNLVIERLLISGRLIEDFANCAETLFQSRYRAASHFRIRRIQRAWMPFLVSISLSSGFSFQGSSTRYRRRTRPVSISLSSGFSFQVIVAAERPKAFRTFQSRYRAASHFRLIARAPDVVLNCVSISLSSGFSFQVRYLQLREA